MSLRTLSHASMPGRRRLATQHVDTTSDDLEVPGIDAPPVPAKVVYRKPVDDCLAVRQLVGESMRAGMNIPRWIAAGKGDPITTVIDPPDPRPARLGTSRGINLRPEALKKSHYQAQSCLATS